MLEIAITLWRFSVEALKLYPCRVWWCIRYQ